MNKLTILYFLLLTTLAACQNTPMEEKFDYTGTLSAPKEYPVRVIDGSLIADNYSQSLYLGGLNNVGWGNTGGIMAVGPDLKDVPHALEITWRSFQEKKWYTGRFELPKEKMLALFKEGYISRFNNKKDTYPYVIIGLAPQGHVVVWLGGGHQVEVATFQAKETQINKEDYHDRTHYIFEEDFDDYILTSEDIMTPEIKARISKRGGLPPMDSYINTYRKQYNWKPVVQLPEGGTFYQIGYNRFNGEIVRLRNEKVNKVSFEKSPLLMNSFGIRGADKLGNKFYIGVEFENEKALLDALSQFSQEEYLEFVFKISNNYEVEKISLRSNEKEIELTPSKIKSYKID